MAAAGKRRKRTCDEQWCSYVFGIERLHAHYSIGCGSRFQRTAYDEHLHPEIEAICLAPAKFVDRRTRFTLIGDRQLEQDLWMQKPEPNNVLGVGTLTMRGRRSDYLGAIPYDAAWRIQPLILAGGLRFIYLNGASMLRGTARITWMAFYEELDPEDF